MLKYIGVKSIDELYSDIPEELLIDEGRWASLNIGFGRPLDEPEVHALVKELLSKNVTSKVPPFMGGGLWPHYVPAAVTEIVRRGEFLTAYTPYQAEISQGLLQALFEYQSMMADLLDMDVVNSSMYDWPSALGEAALMSVRIKGVKRVLVPETINPFHLRVLETYTRPQGIAVDKYKVDLSTGYADLEDLKAKAGQGASSVYLEYPYTFTGVVDVNARAIGEVAHDSKALYIVGVNPLALGLYKPPGELGADIAVGEGQPLGLGLYYGGSTLGILAVGWSSELVRQMPGRIIGLTTTKDGASRAFTMILQTREQHIRRSKATSNITTNAALNAIAAAVYLALLGPKGLKELAESIWYRSHYAALRLREAGFKAPALSGEFFEDLIVETPVSYEGLFRRLAAEGLYAGIPLAKYANWAKDSWGLLSFSELHTKEHIDILINSMKEVN